MTSTSDGDGKDVIANTGDTSGSKPRYYALGFGSNYYGALGATARAHPATSLACATEAGDTAGSSNTQHERESELMYDWGHVQFLTLGQENMDCTSSSGNSGGGGGSHNPSTASKVGASASDGKTNTKRKTSSATYAAKSAGVGFKKGFLLSSPKRSKGKKATAAAAAAVAAASSVAPKDGDTNACNEPVVEATEALPAATQHQSSPVDNDDAKTSAIAILDGDDVANHDENGGNANSDDDAAAQHPPEEEQPTAVHPSQLPAPLSHPPALIAAGSTYTVYSAGAGTTIMQSGTMHGMASQRFVPRPVRMPLKCLQLACGRRHVLSLMGDGHRIDSMSRTRMHNLFDGPVVPMKASGEGGGGGNNHNFSGPIQSAHEALTTGIVMSWGSGHFGQLGHGPEVTDCPEPTVVEGLLPRSVGGPIIHVAAGVLNSAAVVATSLASTRVFLFGSNRRGQCGTEGGKCNTVPYASPLMNTENPDTGRSVNFVRIGLGRLHGVGLTESGEVYTWGSGTNGRLGHGDSVSAGAAKIGKGVRAPRRVESLKNVAVIQVSAGDGHTLCLTGGGRVFAWGTGSEGQLGQGHTMHLLSPRLVGDLDFAGIHNTYDSYGKLLPRKPSSQKLDASSAETKDGQFRSSLYTSMDKGHDSIAPALPSFLTSPEAIEAFSNSTPDMTPQKPPKIVSLYAAGDYSTALSSSGDLYTWGYGDANQIGHNVPPASPSSSPFAGILPYIEPGPFSKTGAGHRIRDSCSFDSRLNVLLPRRVECTREMGLKVEKACAGPGHMILVCSERAPEQQEADTVGLTLYEIEMRRRSLGLSKLRLLGSSRKKQMQQNDSRIVATQELSSSSKAKAVNVGESKPRSTTKDESSNNLPPRSTRVEQAYRESVAQSSASLSLPAAQTQISGNKIKSTAAQKPSSATGDRGQVESPHTYARIVKQKKSSKSSPFTLLKKTMKKVFGRKG